MKIIIVSIIIITNVNLIWDFFLAPYITFATTLVIGHLRPIVKDQTHITRQNVIAPLHIPLLPLLILFIELSIINTVLIPLIQVMGHILPHLNFIIAAIYN